MVIGPVNVFPPSFETATTCRFGYFVESAFSVQNASTVPSPETASWPVSRNPCAKLLLPALICTAELKVWPSSSECATKSFTFPFPAHVLQYTAQKTYRRPKCALDRSTAIHSWSSKFDLLSVEVASAGADQVVPSSWER